MNQLTGPNNPYPEVVLGAYADLLLVDGNPLEDILLLADPDPNLEIIMHNGH